MNTLKTICLAGAMVLLATLPLSAQTLEEEYEESILEQEQLFEEEQERILAGEAEPYEADAPEMEEQFTEMEQDLSIREETELYEQGYPGDADHGDESEREEMMDGEADSYDDELFHDEEMELSDENAIPSE